MALGEMQRGMSASFWSNVTCYIYVGCGNELGNRRRLWWVSVEWKKRGGGES